MKPLEGKVSSTGVERTRPLPLPPSSPAHSMEGRGEMRAVSGFQFAEEDGRMLRGGDSWGVKKLTSVTGDTGREEERKPCVASLRQSGGQTFQ